MRNRSRLVGALSLVLTAPALIAAQGATGHVSAKVTNLRSEKGQILACMTQRADSFPKCKNDPQARTAIVPAKEGAVIDFGAVPAGRYAIALVHDENANRKMDIRLMMPREGFGFSRDAKVSFGPPKFDSAAFTTDGTDRSLSIRMRYML